MRFGRGSLLLGWWPGRKVDGAYGLGLALCEPSNEHD